MPEILAFSGSNSPTSINHQLIKNVVGRVVDRQVELLDLIQLHIPLYSIVLEKKGIPEDVKFLYEKIQENPALIIAVNEYNANVSGFFKNIVDWLSRVDRKFLQQKQILLMSTSPGQRGGAAALAYCKSQFPRFGGQVLESFSLPFFYENFDVQTGKMTNEVFELGVVEVLTSFLQQTGS